MRRILALFSMTALAASMLAACGLSSGTSGGADETSTADLTEYKRRTIECRFVVTEEDLDTPAHPLAVAPFGFTYVYAANTERNLPRTWVRREIPKSHGTARPAEHEQVYMELGQDLFRFEPYDGELWSVAGVTGERGKPAPFSLSKHLLTDNVGLAPLAVPDGGKRTFVFDPGGNGVTTNEGYVTDVVPLISQWDAQEKQSLVGPYLRLTKRPPRDEDNVALRFTDSETKALLHHLGARPWTSTQMPAIGEIRLSGPIVPMEKTLRPSMCPGTTGRAQIGLPPSEDNGLRYDVTFCCQIAQPTP